MERKNSQLIRDEKNSKILITKPFLEEDFIDFLYHPHTVKRK